MMHKVRWLGSSPPVDRQDVAVVQQPVEDGEQAEHERAEATRGRDRPTDDLLHRPGTRLSTAADRPRGGMRSTDLLVPLVWV